MVEQAEDSDDSSFQCGQGTPTPSGAGSGPATPNEQPSDHISQALISAGGVTALVDAYLLTHLLTYLLTYLLT